MILKTSFQNKRERLGLWCLTPLSTIYIVAVSFIGGGNRSIRRKPQNMKENHNWNKGVTKAYPRKTISVVEHDLPHPLSMSVLTPILSPSPTQGNRLPVFAKNKWKLLVLIVHKCIQDSTNYGNFAFSSPNLCILDSNNYGNFAFSSPNLRCSQLTVIVQSLFVNKSNNLYINQVQHRQRNNN